ncbi:hypothetical protein WBG78_23005 [Chryseolinea sp. T2]|uniref:hypothetical protein n=1 Tax=Chryseolinea sp. T2 TaxID=3129255 RepID=UPI003077FA0B
MCKVDLIANLIKKKVPGYAVMVRIVFVALLVFPIQCYAQYDGHGYDTTKLALSKTLTDYAWSVKASYMYQAGNYVELGILRQKYHQDLYYHPGELYGTSGPSIACEVNLDFDKKIFGPKVAYEVSVLRFFTAKANLIYYTDFDRSALSFTPELGLSFFGFVVVSGRYCIPFSNKDLLYEDSFDALGLSVTINFPVSFKSLTVLEMRDRMERK